MPFQRIETPCISICEMDPLTGLCAGCFRSLEEIANWSSYSDEQRKKIMEELKSRKGLVA